MGLPGVVTGEGEGCRSYLNLPSLPSFERRGAANGTPKWSLRGAGGDVPSTAFQWDGPLKRSGRAEAIPPVAGLSRLHPPGPRRPGHNDKTALTLILSVALGDTPAGACAVQGEGTGPFMVLKLTDH